MKTAKLAVGIALVAGTLACGAAWADRGHSQSRVTFGINLGVPLGPWYYPPYYYPPYYPPYPPVIAVPAYPNVVAVPPSPPVYIEKAVEPSGGPAPSSNYWYYCPNPPGYYPYVRECQGGWMTVLPQSPGQSGIR